MRLYVCCKYKDNNLYHVSREDVKWLSYLGVKYYSFHIWFHYCFHNEIIGFMFEKFAMKLCYLSLTPFFCLVYSQDTLQSISKNNRFDFFLSVRFNELLQISKTNDETILKESVTK